MTPAKLNAMPAQAPSTVGIIDSASSQYVLRNTALRASSEPDVVVAPYAYGLTRCRFRFRSLSIETPDSS